MELGSIEACTVANRNQFQHQRCKIVDDAGSNPVGICTRRSEGPLLVFNMISDFSLENSLTIHLTMRKRLEFLQSLTSTEVLILRILNQLS